MLIELLGDFTPTPITYGRGDFMEYVWMFLFTAAIAFGFFSAKCAEEGKAIVESRLRISNQTPTTILQAPEVITIEKPEPKPKKKTFDENDWNEICEAAVEKAKTGDARSRDWVLEHIFNKSDQNDTKTSKEIIEDCTWALINYGHKKADAIKLVNEKAAGAEYSSVEELLKDILKKV